MYPVSDAVAALFDSEQRQLLRITGTDRNGAEISITDEDALVGSFAIDRYCCNGKKLEIGTAIASEMLVQLRNPGGKYDDIIFEGAELFVEIGIADWEAETPEVTWIPCGVFVPDEQPRRLNVITLIALDRMVYFDNTVPTLTPWTTETGEIMRTQSGEILYFCADLTFPATVASLVEQISVRCNVPFNQNILALPNATYLIQEMPQLQGDVTFRNILQWCAGLMGTNAYIDWDGNLQFAWYAGNSGYNSTLDRRFSSDMYENDIVITGVTFTDSENRQFVAGSESYALDMSDNNLLAAADDTNRTSLMYSIYAVVNGFTYRPFEASVINAPWLYPMDRVSFTDKDGIVHLTLLTNVNTTVNGSTELKGSGETAQANAYAPISSFTPAQQVSMQKVLQLNADQMNAAIQSATDYITGAEGSHVRFMYDADGHLSEILVMDTDDIATAANVWRWNSGGLGHSSNGYGGPYTLAMTQDGSIVATMITSGIMNATVIKAGILQDAAGLNSWNLATGDLTMTTGSINIGNGKFEVDSNGNMSCTGATVNGEMSATWTGYDPDTQQGDGHYKIEMADTGLAFYKNDVMVGKINISPEYYTYFDPVTGDPVSVPVIVLMGYNGWRFATGQNDVIEGIIQGTEPT